MAEALYMVSVEEPEKPHKEIINGIHVVLINSDDGGTDADIIAEAEVKVKAAGHNIPDDYFDTVTAIGDLTSGPLPDDTDTMIIGDRWTETELA